MFDFLRPDARKKIFRTTLYGDQEFTPWEMEILQTPLVQRLYNLKQLGLADRIYPDAVHSRFNHSLGVAEMAERMAVQLADWLERRGSTTLSYAFDRSTQAEEPSHERMECSQLAKHVRRTLPSIRLMGLLHDITHAAFGHTLEDEVQVFSEKHDTPTRQVRFFNGLVAQLFYIWCTEARIRDVDHTILAQLTQLLCEPDQFKSWADENSRVPR